MAIATLSLNLSASTAGLRTDLLSAGNMVEQFNRSATKSFQQQQYKQAYASVANQQKYGSLGGAVDVGNKIGGLGGIPGLGGVAQTTKGLVNTFTSTADAFAEAGPEVAAVAGAVAALGSAAANAFPQMIALAGITNPMALQRYNTAWQDLYGVLGRMFVPMLSMATEGVRDFADFLATVQPNAQELKTFWDSFRPILDDFRSTLVTIAPIVKTMLSLALQTATIYSQGMEKVQWLQKMSPTLDPTLGVGGLAMGAYNWATGAKGGLDPSNHAAGVMPSYTGWEDVSKSAIQASLSSGQEDKQQTMIALLQRQVVLMEAEQARIAADRIKGGRR